MTTRAEELDTATIDLIFALRDSLTPDGPSRLDFWSGGRVHSAITTAAAGSETGAQAVTTAARKLQIEQIAATQAATIKKVVAVIDVDYQEWARHIDQNIVYIHALADIQRQANKPVKSPKEPTTKPVAPTPVFDQEPIF